MTQFYGCWIFLEGFEQPAEIFDGGIIQLEARRKLAEQRAQLTCVSERIDAALEHVHILLFCLSLVREILKQLKTKLEASWRSFRPGLRRLRRRRPIERVIYLDCVEAVGVVSEFVELQLCARNGLPLLQWIED